MNRLKAEIEIKELGKANLSHSFVSLLLLILVFFSWLLMFDFRYHTQLWVFWCLRIIFYSALFASIVIALRTIRSTLKLFKIKRKVADYMALGISGIVLLIITIFLTVLINQW